MVKKLYQPKSLLVLLLIKLLIIGQLCVMLSVSTNAFVDLFGDNLWWFTDAKFSADGYSDLINQAYYLVYFTAVYILYLFILILTLTANDLDCVFIRIMQYLKHQTSKFNSWLSQLLLSCQICQIRAHNQVQVKTCHFTLVQAEVSSSYLPFI